jgi:hypothetical protein
VAIAIMARLTAIGWTPRTGYAAEGVLFFLLLGGSAAGDAVFIVSSR